MVEHRTARDFVPVVILCIHPEHRDGLDPMLARDGARQLHRGDGFEQREERPAERAGLLAGDDCDGAGIGERPCRVARGRWSQAAADAASARLHAVRDPQDLAGCELVIEAAPEDLELKRALFARLAEVCGPAAILATNTSSLSVTAVAAGIERPERVCGMHFFNLYVFSKMRRRALLHKAPPPVAPIGQVPVANA